MPSIYATPYPTEGYVLVEIDWSDVPAVTYATVYRVNETTGAQDQLRPYVSYDSTGAILLNCGMAVFWDTEVPLDVPVHYVTSASPIPKQLNQNSTFETTVSPWTTFGAGTWQISSNHAHEGVNAGQFTPSGVSTLASITSESFQIINDNDMTFSFWVYSQTGWNNINTRIFFSTSAGQQLDTSYIDVSQGQFIDKGIWVYFTTTIAVPPAAATAQITVNMNGTTGAAGFVPAGAIFYFDQMAATQPIDADQATSNAVLLDADTFTRTTASSWGTSDNGVTYNLNGGANSDYSTNGTQGLIAHNTINVARRTTVTATATNIEGFATFAPPVVALGASYEQQLEARRNGTLGNSYRAGITWGLTGVATLNVLRLIANVSTNIGSFVLPFTYVVGTQARVRFRILGSNVMAKAWVIGTPEPTWQVSVTDTNVTSGGSYGRRDLVSTGNTNPVPIITATDDMYFYDLLPVTGQSITIAGNERFFLRSPLHPCDDRVVSECWTPDPNCDTTTAGIFFQSLTDETYAGHSVTLDRFAQATPVSVYRTRRAAASTLSLVTRLYSDRQHLEATLATGAPLLWQAPADYGQVDRYINVGDTTIQRYADDHRYTPRRFVIPHIVVDRPPGPSTGVCGTRFTDLCDVYTSWNAMKIAGLTWQMILEGAASLSSPGDNTAGYRTWTTVNTGFASWTAVDTPTTRTWTNLQQGS